VKNKPDFATVWNSLSDWLEGASFFIAHNAAFDKSVLRACCEFYNLPYPRIPWKCSYRNVSKVFWPRLPNQKLSTVCRFLGIELNHHEALSDARASARILQIAHKEGFRF